MNKHFECKSLAWDTDYFGIDSARVNLFDEVTQPEIETILNFTHKYKFVTIYNYNNINKNNLWLGIQTKAFLADMNVQFEKDIVPKAQMPNEGVRVDKALPYNADIMNVARQAFRYSRFFNDDFLPKEKALRIYEHWTLSAFNQENKHFVTVEKEEKIVGYLLFIVMDSYAVIELIAVDSAYQGQRLGQMLIKALEDHLLMNEIYKVKVGTQVNNILASQFYTKMGFHYVSCSSVYHLWK